MFYNFILQKVHLSRGSFEGGNIMDIMSLETPQLMPGVSTNGIQLFVNDAITSGQFF